MSTTTTAVKRGALPVLLAGTFMIVLDFFIVNVALPSMQHSLHAGQVPVAQVIRRFRELGMPVDEVRSMLNAPDDETRNKVIIAHLDRMEAQLAETTSTVVSLRGLLEGPALTEPVEYRHVAPFTALAITSRLRVEEFEAWWGRAFSELRAELANTGLKRAGPDGALYPGEFFELEEAEVTAYVPVTEGAGGSRPASGGAELVEIPGAELAVMVHEGGYGDTDRTYGALGTAVTTRGLGVDGPIREHYLLPGEKHHGETLIDQGFLVSWVHQFGVECWDDGRNPLG